MSRESPFRDLDPECKARLAAGLEYDSWEEVPDVVQRNLRARNTNLDPILNGELK